MLEQKISNNIEKDEYSYFFTMLTDRFEPLNLRWQQALEKQFNKPFKPIHVLAYRHNGYFEEENYIVLNHRLEKLTKSMGRKDIINLIYPEDLNKEFSSSKYISSLIERLVRKQGKVYVVGFTSVWLNINNPNVIVLGPDSKVAGSFDAKQTHVETFKALGMKTISTKVFKNFEDLLKGQETYPFFLSAMYSSGGIESKSIFTAQDLNAYYSNLRPVNQKEPLLASKFIEDITLAPNTTAVVTGPNKTTMVSVSDQILRNNQYMGNIYPSKVNDHQRKLIEDMTLKVGDFLSSKGYRGLFGMDFLITASGECYPVDLNPRRQGGYFCVVMASKKVNLIELELSLALGLPIKDFHYSDFQCDYSWAHSKLSPYFSNVKIKNEVAKGDPVGPFRDIGSTFEAIYYPKDHTLIMGNPGFYLTTGRSYDEIKSKLHQETEKLISINYELYEG